jgi:chorismate dehydratase
MMRIAASTYLNSAPLVYSFAQGSLQKRYRFMGDAAPARCAGLLATGECDIALIPAIEYQRLRGLRIIPGVAVASKGRVRSVVIAARRPLAEVRSLALDTSSRTSQALVRIIFRHRFGIEPRLIERMPDPATGYANMVESADAALVIGDPAMRIEARAEELGLTIHDLAAEWRAMTGHPFVFAIWAVREEVLTRVLVDPVFESELTADFQAARQEGLNHLPAIAAEYVAELGLPVEDLLDYLRNNVNYELDAENLGGLGRYYDLASHYGLIPHHHPLRFLGQPDAARARPST